MINENEVPTNEDEVDALLGSIEEPSDSASTDPGADDAKQSAAAQDFAFTVGGKEVKVDLNKDREKLIRWAQQGYEAPNKLGELNKQLQAWTAKEQAWKTQEAKVKEYQDKYEGVDKYIRENPQWWSTVQAEFQKAQSGAQGQAVDPRFDTLKQEIDGLKQVAQTYQERVQQQQMQQEDAKYIEEFNTVQKQYPKIDFVSPDETGRNLEYKVLEYAQEKGIREFTAAFKAFHHDELVKLAQEEAKQKVISDKQSKTKLGILGISSTPTPRKTDSVRGKSYNDLAGEALEELGL